MRSSRSKQETNAAHRKAEELGHKMTMFRPPGPAGVEVSDCQNFGCYAQMFYDNFAVTSEFRGVQGSAHEVECPWMPSEPHRPPVGFTRWNFDKEEGR